MGEQLKVTTLGIIYGCVISVCYLMGFWKTFNINVFQYASITDVLKAAILPLAITILGILLTYFFMEGPRLIVPRSNSTPTSNSTSRLDKLLLALLQQKELIAIVWLGVASLTYQWIHEPGKYFVLVVASMPFGAVLMNAEFFSLAFPNPRLRRTVAFLVTPLPFTSLFVGSLDAHKIIDNHADYIVESESLGARKTVTKSENLEYIGLVGNTLFLYDPASKGLVLIKQSDGLILQLSPNPLKN
jgi:hypothetical protein